MSLPATVPSTTYNPRLLRSPIRAYSSTRDCLLECYCTALSTAQELSSAVSLHSRTGLPPFVSSVVNPRFNSPRRNTQLTPKVLPRSWPTRILWAWITAHWMRSWISLESRESSLINSPHTCEILWGNPNSNCCAQVHTLLGTRVLLSESASQETI